MKTKKLIAIAVACVSWTSLSWGRSEQLPTMYQATTVTTSTTTTTINSATIQSLGQQADANTKKGSSLASAGMAITAVGVAATCWAGPASASLCKMFVAGLVVTTAVKMFMGNASNQSTGTVQAVTTAPDDPYHLNDAGKGPSTTGSDPTEAQTPNYANDPDYKKARDTLSKLENQGWKIDLKKGTATSPDGHTIKGSDLNNPSAMQAAGISKSDFNAFQNEMSKVPGLAAQKTKSADAGSDLLGDSAGGGGKSGSAGANPYGGLAMGSGPKLGISRDPAQVAGLAKTLANGEKVGVADDDMWVMIHRRVKVENEKLPFIP